MGARAISGSRFGIKCNRNNDRISPAAFCLKFERSAKREINSVIFYNRYLRTLEAIDA